MAYVKGIVKNIPIQKPIIPTAENNPAIIISKRTIKKCLSILLQLLFMAFIKVYSLKIIRGIAINVKIEVV